MLFPHRRSENEVLRIRGNRGDERPSAETNFSKEGGRRRRSSA